MPCHAMPCHAEHSGGKGDVCIVCKRRKKETPMSVGILIRLWNTLSNWREVIVTANRPLRAQEREF
jgi:hypothetical protein